MERRFQKFKKIFYAPNALTVAPKNWSQAIRLPKMGVH